MLLYIKVSEPHDRVSCIQCGRRRLSICGSPSMHANSGPPDEPAGETIRDGKLQTWLQVPGEEPLLVVDQQNMGWRVYNNVSIDTLYFSVFYGGSSERFRAQKDEVCLLNFYFLVSQHDRVV